MKYALNYALIGFGLLPYLLLFTGQRMSDLYVNWLDVGWIFIVVGALNLAEARAEKQAKIEAEAKVEMERVLALRETALREKIREEVIAERLLHSLN